MKLVIALGNPGQQYAGTRHNAGFYVLDTVAAAHGLKWQPKAKYKAEVAQNGDYILAKPSTYYNQAGESARAIADFYKIPPHDILVLHDDFALPIGTVRTRTGGGDAGNNGIKSLNQHLGPGTARLRVGVYAPMRDQVDDTDFVLGRFSAAEKAVVDSQLPKITEVIESFLAGTFQSTTHK